MSIARLLCVVTLVMPGLFAAAQTNVQDAFKDEVFSRAKVGVSAVRLGAAPGQERFLVHSEAAEPLAPASNMKLVTMAMALDALGPDFRFRTRLCQVGKDLVLLGDGDPALGDAEVLQKVGWNASTVFELWAKELKARNVTDFGDLIVDASIFDDVAFSPGWPVEQRGRRYVAPVSGLTLNVNCLDFHVEGSAGTRPSVRLEPRLDDVRVDNQASVGRESTIGVVRRGDWDYAITGTCPPGERSFSIGVPDPAIFTAMALDSALKAGGIRRGGRIVRGTLKRAADGGVEGGTIVAMFETPLPKVLARAGKDSMNLYAECLAKRIVAEKLKRPGNWDDFSRMASAFLKHIKAQEGQWTVIDGCGLSKTNRLSPDTIVAVLEYANRAAWAKTFRDSLAVGGVDGTLEKRFVSPQLRGRVLAKTGYILGASALSGYIMGDREPVAAFSMVVNGVPDGNNAKAKAAFDAVVASIDAASR